MPIISFGASVPTNGSQSLNRVIPNTPKAIRVAEFGLSVPRPQAKVHLHATIGVTSLVVNPTILFQVFRNSQVIFSMRHQTTVAVGESESVSFHAVDLNPPTGYHAYYFTAKVENPTLGTNQASEVGPVTFTGLNYTE
ncbi:hypothetical protein KUV80_13560 [Fictibacillus nanhaiensis]|uniref:hypothetical protein n=1 Tax=Fictibacillus nanhaiensis TaxID=742169 RepID=UPI001C9897F0|nr:hypothetical protein [Fictibacillus nanhaiensis]MBY6037692.1 hypothetical protein [Fictibacillus nanhaiensis]